MKLKETKKYSEVFYISMDILYIVMEEVSSHLLPPHGIYHAISRKFVCSHRPNMWRERHVIA